MDAAGQDHGWCNRREILHRDITLARVNADVLPHIQWQAAAEIVIALAGTLAEARYRQRSRAGAALFVSMNAESFLTPGAFDVDGDFERIRRTLDYIEAPNRQATFTCLVDTCDQVLAANWKAVNLLADELRRDSVLGPDAVETWFERHPAEPWRGDLGI